MSIKFDFSKAEDIVEVTHTCDNCGGSGGTYRGSISDNKLIRCDKCNGSGKIKQFMTAKAIREMLKDKE